MEEKDERPNRRIHNITLLPTELKRIELGFHNNLLIFSIDDTILTCPTEETFSGVGTQVLMDPGPDPLELYGDRRQHISLQSNAIVNARVRIITW